MVVVAKKRACQCVLRLKPLPQNRNEADFGDEKADEHQRNQGEALRISD